MISDYVDSLADRLSFDRALSQRVRREVEDHLRETAAADCTGDALEAERRAVVTFGDPHLIAAQFAAASLARQARRVGGALILVIAGVFVAMKARLAWYAAAPYALNGDARAVGDIVVSIDRFAFWLSIAVGTVSWAYISSRRAPASLRPSYHKELRRFLLLCSTATCGLVASVIGDGVLTGLRLLETDSSLGFLIPVLSMAIETACAGALVLHVRGVSRRMASTEVRTLFTAPPAP